MYAVRVRVVLGEHLRQIGVMVQILYRVYCVSNLDLVDNIENMYCKHEIYN